MAPTTYTVKPKNTVWSLCAGKYGPEYAAAIAGNTITAKENTIIRLNNLKRRASDPSVVLIYTGQVLRLNENGSSSSPAPSSSTSSNDVVITSFGIPSDSTSRREAFVSWTWSKLKGYLEKGTFDKFKIRWEWDSPDPSDSKKYITRFQDAETKDTWATFEIPKEFQKTANWIQIFITPIAKNKVKDNGEDTGKPEWTAKKIGKKYNFADNPPLAPDTPTCEIDGTTLTITLDSIKKETDASHIVFQVIKDNSYSAYKSDKIPIEGVTDDYSKASWIVYDVPFGSNYKARAKSVGANGKESGWSDFSEERGTKPSAPSAITTYRRNKRTDGVISAYLEWTAVPNAKTYKVEYTTVKSDFELAPDNVKHKSTVDARTSLEITDILTGVDYFFRVRAVNENGESDPTEPVELPIGQPPAAPATYSSANSAFVGENMELNWIHNPVDNSKQSFAEVSLKINDSDWVSFVYENTTDADNTGERIDVDDRWAYGDGISYKGTLYFKMDTEHPDLKNATVVWRIRTAGVTDQFSDTAWSVERTIYIYEKPSLNLSMTGDLAGTGAIITVLESFPFYIRGRILLSDYKIQHPIGYHLRIVANEYYVTTDDEGKTKTVNAGDEVYSKYFDTSEVLVVEMSANNIDLQSGINYTVYCSADMSTGLSVTNQHDFTVNWIDVVHAINANISVNTDTYTALITPYCLEKIPVPGGKNLFNTNAVADGSFGVYTVNSDNSITFNYESNYGNYFPFGYWLDVEPNTDYTVSIGQCTSILTIYGYTDKLFGNQIFGKQAVKAYDPITFNSGDHTRILLGFYSITAYRDLTVTEETVSNIQIELGSEATEYEEYYESYEDGNLVDNVTLAVYRREYDGSYKEIATGIPNNYTSVTDPHPALDYARYRFVAKDTNTGAVSYWDMAGYPVNGQAVMLQWDEEWSTFYVGESTTTEEVPWSGSLLRLPYNIKVSDKRNREVALVEYAGREHPVSYYGTQLGETSQWSVEIPADDKETIYMLRRLSIWPGNVYVREPSGMGYWANVVVSFNQAYNDVKIPVSLDITRVEGGV